MRQHLKTLPFAEGRVCSRLLEKLFEVVPGLIGNSPDLETLRLADAFGWCCFSFWQCGSAFPAYPEEYATFLLQELFKPASRRTREASTIARILTGPGSESGRCGFNAFQLHDPACITESERAVLSGDYELYLKAGAKYREYLLRLERSSEFRRDWAAFKKAFPTQAMKKGVLHRTLIPERNWFKDRATAFLTSESKFQAAFDLFCWKYFLWGMKGNKPLLLKPSVVFTPLGTQIFIPGYLSFDAKRDLNLSRLSRLHKARGVVRQGERMSMGRQELVARAHRAKILNLEAKELGLKGDNRYRFIATRLRLTPAIDFRQIRCLIGLNPHP